ncbi:MAG: PSD1 domain-containing protein [Armatimonadetes bacterium]|nr:PSD1 domain-containing protein [Armatimonadota bacterium]
MARHRLLSAFFAGCGLLPFALALAPQEPGHAKQQLFFEDAPRIALNAHCGVCHSGSTAKAGLDLTTLAGVMKGGRSGKVVVPGNAQDSLLIVRLEGRGGKEQMPLGFRPLAPEKIKAIRDWIDGGCKSNGGVVSHWAYVPPKLPALPVTKQKGWTRNPIDAFVLAKLEANGLKPSHEATKETLARRLYLDLTGLPPSPSEMDAYLRDKSPKAYEALVDRLLASPHYGERMARPWLDLARYADSDGYEKDLNRTAWKYRDWVIDAFNQNMPYDEFTTEQLAGDMLPNATIEQQVATGFNRNAMFNSEGGVDPGEAQFNVVIDRVNTTSTVFMGSTLQCARCHDHKYDPFTQKDFYKLYAVFDNTAFDKVGDYKKGQEQWYEPVIEVPTPEQARRRSQLEAQIAKAESALKEPDAETLRAFDAWLKDAGQATVWSVVKPSQVTSAAGQALTEQSDGSYLASGKAPANDVYTIEWTSNRANLTGVRIEVLPDPSFPNRGPGRASSGNFILTKAELASNGADVPIGSVATSFTQQGYDAGRVIPGDAANGWAIFNAYGQASEMAVIPAKALSLPPMARLRLVLRFDSQQWPEHVIGRFRVSESDQAEPRVLPNMLRQALGDPAKIEANRPALLVEFEKSYAPTKEAMSKLAAASQELAALRAAIPTAMVLKERPGDTIAGNVHIRGEWLQKGETVAGGPPAVLSPKPPTSSFNRLELAKWLVSKDNPLTARVEVNRLWETVFGKGLVETSEDFGSQGSPPTHPELLDWLSVTFMNSGWDMKAMVRLMVTSATYRQGSDATPALLEKDPQNQLLARAPRYRMEAEAVRDNMLAIGGVLSLKLGGPSVYPSQPPAIWDTPYNGQRWMTSDGQDRYRRGLYTFWKRSAPYPAFLAMDATSRETCTVRRIRSNTPLQALALLNDEVAMDAAKGLAKRMASEGGKTTAARIAFGFRCCTGRRPNSAEAKLLSALYDKLLARYVADKTAAGKLAETAEGAATVMVANTLLNMDETISRS